MNPATKPSGLFIYFTYTNQTRKVIDAMAEVLRGRGCDVQLATIEFTDPRYAGRFKEFPMPHPFRELVGMIPPTNLQEHHLQEARKFADGLASRLLVSAGEPG